MVFLCAGAFNSVGVLLRSASAEHPNGLANGSGVLGRYSMDHANGLAAVGPVPGFEAHTTFGNRPTGIIVPRFRNVTTRDERFLRGYSYQGGAFQRSWTRGQGAAGLGADFKAQLRGPLLRSKLMAVKGTWQRDGDVRNLIAGHVEDLTALLGGLATSSRDFH